MDAVTQWLYPLLVVTVVIGLLIGIRVWIESVNLKLRGDIKDIFHVLSKAVMAGQSPFELTDLGDNISRCMAPSLGDPRCSRIKWPGIRERTL